MEQLQYNEEIAKTIYKFLDSDLGDGIKAWDYIFDREKGKFRFYSLTTVRQILFMQIQVGQNDVIYSGLYGIHVPADDIKLMKKVRQYIDQANENIETDNVQKFENIENHFELDDSTGIIRFIAHANYSKHLPTNDDIGFTISMLIYRLITNCDPIVQIIKNNEENNAELKQVINLS
jgi:hypothetical protein